MPQSDRPSLEQRFWSKVDKSGGPNACWPFLGNKGIWGHGRFSIHGQDIYAHRVAYSLAHNDPPPGMLVLHKCDNAGCVNPAHLFLGTQSDNIRDAVSKGRWFRPGKRGQENASSKLTEAQVITIRDRYRSGGVTQQELADEYRVHFSNISVIVHHKSWTHI